MKKLICLCLSMVVLAGCAGGMPPPDTVLSAVPGTAPVRDITSIGGITFGDPIAVSIGIAGNLLVADGSMGRVLRIDVEGDTAVEFESPSQSPSFYPSDIKASGFFVYALDTAARALLRFDRTGAYRDVLISFDRVLDGRRSEPVGLDVDNSGRIVVTDRKNHAVILFNGYLQVELAFGNYGTAAGQFDAPEGVTFTKDGGFLVADTGNRRLQFFDAGGKHLKTIPSSGETSMQRPRRAVVDAEGNTWVADPEAGRVFVFDSAGTLAREVVPIGVQRYRPMDVAVATGGTVYVADSANAAIYVFR